jgi:hypothetical protein
MGLAREAIPNDAFGDVVWFGNVEFLALGSFTTGQILWFDTVNGGLTATEPATNKIQIAAVQKASSTPSATNGILLVRIKYVSRDIDEIDGLTDALSELNDKIEVDEITTHTQTESIKTVPVGTLESTVDNFEADGLTLVNSVVNGDFSNGTTSWTTNDGTLSVSSGNLLLSGSTTQFPRIIQNVNFKSGDIYFAYAKVKNSTTTSLEGVISFRYASGAVATTPKVLTQNIFIEHFGKLTLANDVNSIWLTNYQTGVLSSTLELDGNAGVFAINMTALGIASYTEAQMLDLVRSGYFDGIANVEKPSVTAVGKNLFDKNSNIVFGSFLDTSGNIINNSLYFYQSSYTPIKSNETYKASVSFSVNIYDSSFNWIAWYSGASAITMPSNASYVRFSDGIDRLEIYQFELGSTATTYEPYKSSTLTIDTELRSLPNGVRDRVYEQNGEVWLDKRVEERVLQASDVTVVLNADDITRVTVQLPSDSELPNFERVLVDGYGYVSPADIIANIGKWTIDNSTLKRLRFYFPLNTTLAAAQAALAGTVIQYQLATPQLINLTQQGKISGELIAFENGTIYNTSDTFHADISFDVASNRSAQISGLLESASYQAKQIENKADLIHTHPISDVVNLQTALNTVGQVAGFNTKLGFEALNNVTAGDRFNTAVGYQSLRVNTTGINNTAQGLSSLGDNTTGNSNTANGASALRGNTSGGNNTAQGVNSGRFIANGSTVNATGGNSVFIGADTKALADNQTNQIVIGHNATGIGSNTVTLGNDSIVTTALKGNVGIGTTSPGSKLELRQSVDTLNGGLIVRDTVGGSTGRAYVSGTSFFLGQGANTNLVLTSAGNVGINTTNPTERLDVVGNIKASGSVTSATVSATTSVTTPSVVATSTVKIGAWTLSQNGTSGSLDFVVV